MSETKKLFTSVYNEDPVKFKQGFNDVIKNKIKDRIDQKKQEIIANINDGVVEDEPEEKE